MTSNSVSGPEILEFLRRYNVSQAELAKAAGVALDRVSLYLREIGKMDAVDAVKLRAGMREIERRSR